MSFGKINIHSQQLLRRLSWLLWNGAQSFQQSLIKEDAVNHTGILIMVPGILLDQQLLEALGGSRNPATFPGWKNFRLRGGSRSNLLAIAKVESGALGKALAGPDTGVSKNQGALQIF